MLLLNNTIILGLLLFVERIIKSFKCKIQGQGGGGGVKLKLADS